MIRCDLQGLMDALFGRPFLILTSKRKKKCQKTQTTQQKYQQMN